jgi:hypothetical protein
MDFDDLQLESAESGLRAHSASKLAATVSASNWIGGCAPLSRRSSA